MYELIKVESQKIGNEEINAVDARGLHAFLESGAQFGNWIQDRIKQYDFVPDTDFISFKRSIKSDSTYINTKEYIISLDMAMVLASKERHPKGAEAYKFFCSFLGNEVVVKHQKRLEFQFGEVIKNLFSEFTVIPQYPVFGNKYFIDWYIPELKLAIEFDEIHHWRDTKKEEIRQLEIEKELGCRFARYDVSISD